MAQDFRTLITELWAKLKLGAPRFGDTETIALSIDGLEVILSESADGRHLLVSGLAGRPARDQHAAEEEVRRLLRTSLGLVQGNRAGLRLDTSGEMPAFRVEGAYPYAANRLDDLTKLIEDVLFRLELHAGELAVSRPGRQTGRPAFTQLSQDNIILNP